MQAVRGRDVSRAYFNINPPGPSWSRPWHLGRGSTYIYEAYLDLTSSCLLHSREVCLSSLASGPRRDGTGAAGTLQTPPNYREHLSTDSGTDTWGTCSPQLLRSVTGHQRRIANGSWLLAPHLWRLLRLRDIAGGGVRCFLGRSKQIEAAARSIGAPPPQSSTCARAGDLPVQPRSRDALGDDGIWLTLDGLTMLPPWRRAETIRLPGSPTSTQLPRYIDGLFRSREHVAPPVMARPPPTAPHAKSAVLAHGGAAVACRPYAISCLPDALLEVLLAPLAGRLIYVPTCENGASHWLSPPSLRPDAEIPPSLGIASTRLGATERHSSRATMALQKCL
ncbi:hypothetical protein K458DRAFT_149254 [Lentithecium fluviatile CBS 122367]|uniref:Uncharacterized protein n=1 Tax=Lentithecium fluviatile CBS 122367 TaxID=1168545 RepID=A0A6G1JDK8_9PLEO|nr:hypothetical protein K458DRAFT_149254 [Lentithecium fluviatile CBS 122367]